MRVQNITSWQIATDFPGELQFAGYVAQQEGFQQGNEGESHSLVETEWRAWWDDLIKSRLAVVEALCNLIDPRPFWKYDPPDFNSLDEVTELQTLCKQHWPEFHKHWGTVGGQEMPTMDRLTEQTNRIRLDKIVKECVRESGKAKSDPFKLQIDFVLWPYNYHNHVSHQHLVLGAQFIQPQYVQELMEVLKDQICSLV